MGRRAWPPGPAPALLPRLPCTAPPAPRPPIFLQPPHSHPSGLTVFLAVPRGPSVSQPRAFACCPAWAPGLCPGAPPPTSSSLCSSPPYERDLPRSLRVRLQPQPPGLSPYPPTPLHFVIVPRPEQFWGQGKIGREVQISHNPPAPTVHTTAPPLSAPPQSGALLVHEATLLYQW